MPENNQKYSNVRIKYRNTHAGDSCSCPVRNYLHDSTGCMSAALQLQYGFAPSSGNHHLRFETGAVQHCQTAGATRPRSSLDNHIITHDSSYRYVL